MGFHHVKEDFNIFFLSTVDVLRFKMACPSLLLIGICLADSCTFNHFVKLCVLCTHVCISSSDYDLHIRGVHHVNAVHPSPLNLHCTTCEREISSHQWSEHISGVPHESASRRLGVLPLDIKPTNGVPPTGQTYCALCNLNVLSWAQHQAGVRHKKKQDFFDLKTALDVAARDKNGITVFPKDGLDFGIISLPNAQGGFNRTFIVQPSDPTAHVRVKIIRVRMCHSLCAPVFSTISFLIIL